MDIQNQFTFKILELSDIPSMFNWFNLPHVQKFYSLRTWTENEVLEKFKPYILGAKPVLGFIVVMDKKPIGYVQLSRVRDYPWPNQNLPEEVINNAAVMDIFIGDESMIGKGIGGKIIRTFIQNKVWPEFQYCIVDPDLENLAAVRCYEKLGFVEHNSIRTVDAFEQAASLRLMILKR
jgi:RimJ/RimL family protein N-acetyltransferase